MKKKIHFIFLEARNEITKLQNDYVWKQPLEIVWRLPQPNRAT